ncbi:SRPBCC family protein [Mycobacterium montefiorense]|uniref:SRPBCC family protein n=1 Tax=Mycobacterium montefiorense TaxID=154654 RepID=UPI0021DE59A8|nr:SRPBCC family protein [Mycobacterium montefiorense]MCV7427141.1 DUF1857 family protein [Mycobacterium montefiorense]GLE53637.1 hypothetical protein ATCCBAA256_32000 [Mycobacterium montefiorense]
MQFAEQTVLANPLGAKPLDRHDVWRGLERKARDAVPYVAAITSCKIVREYTPTSFDRAVVIQGEVYVERVDLDPPNRVIFTRLKGPVLGVITNEILDGPEHLQLRFKFALTYAPGAQMPVEEEQLIRVMSADYCAAVKTTLSTCRAQLEE